MWTQTAYVVDCKCKRISLPLFAWREATNGNTSASACYVVAILKESYFQWLITRFRCFSLFYSSVALTFESVNNHSNKRCTLPLHSTVHHRHLVYVF